MKYLMGWLLMDDIQILLLHFEYLVKNLWNIWWDGWWRLLYKYSSCTLNIWWKIFEIFDGVVANGWYTNVSAALQISGEKYFKLLDQMVADGWYINRAAALWIFGEKLLKYLMEWLLMGDMQIWQLHLKYLVKKIF